jgi:hypothetical protein
MQLSSFLVMKRFAGRKMFRFFARMSRRFKPSRRASLPEAKDKIGLI